MKRHMSRLYIFFTLFITAVIISACGNESEAIQPNEQPSSQEQAPQAPQPKNEAVTISMFFDEALSDPTMQELFYAPIQRKFPHVTLQMIKKGSGSQIDNLIASGNIPDIIFTAMTRLPALHELELPQPLNELAKTYQTDLATLDPGTLSIFQTLTDSGSIFAYPYYSNRAPLFYNKDLFDRFGVSYPKDGMTWDQSLDLARIMTRNENQVQYYGLLPTGWNLMSFQLSLPLVDLSAKKALINTDEFRKILQLHKDFFSIPGQEYINSNNLILEKFMKDGTIAMFNFWMLNALSMLDELHQAGKSVPWDMVTQPSFAEKPNVSSRQGSHYFMLTSASKHKEQAYEIIAHLAASEVAQTVVSRSGRIPVLLNQTVQQQFGADNPSMKGKNLNAIFSTQTAVPAPVTQYDSIVNSQINNARKKVAEGTIDVNSALREAQEAADKEIAAALK